MQQLTPPKNIREGKLSRSIGLTLEATGCQATMGTRCEIIGASTRVDSEVVGFTRDKLFLMPVDSTTGLESGARVIPTGSGFSAPVGDALLGRVIDGTGRAIDGLGTLPAMSRRSIQSTPVNPLQRGSISEPIDVGVRAINGLLTIGRGQRVGLMAGSGVGKSQLLGMMTRYSDADVIVIGLIGERGREVKTFIDKILGPEGRKRSVVVAVPADNTAMRRLHGAMLAATIAEHFRDQGKHVLLLMDSLTRFAQAQREIGLAIGEPPTTKGYPPSVFQSLPQLVERAGIGASGGSVTAFYTVLAENDDNNDPIVDAARAILDGHIVLSRSVAESGVYPAIDIEASLSRLVTDLVDDEHLHAISVFRQLYSSYRQNAELITLGVYQAGTNPVIDKTIQAWPRLCSYIQQGLTEHIEQQDSQQMLLRIASDFTADMEGSQHG